MCRIIIYIDATDQIKLNITTIHKHYCNLQKVIIIDYKSFYPK